MKKFLFFKILVTGAIFISLSAQAQSDRIGYVVTDSVLNGVKWNFLRTLNLSTMVYGSVLTRLLNSNDTPHVSNPNLVNGTAAIALDKRNKRVYFAPMLLDKLSYVDMRNFNRVTVRNNFTGLMPKKNDQSNILTRMVINGDGHGYALTNDGNNLVSFKTNGNANVSNLGSLVDANSNGEVSVHNICTSGGGDLIATEDDDILYLISFRNLIFKINLENKVAKYIGMIKGLPATFFTAGVAVDQTGRNVILVSSVDKSDVYILNMNSLVASPLNAHGVLHSSDLASAGILKMNRDWDDNRGNNQNQVITDNILINDKIQLYPNPVTGNEFKISFSDCEAGTYTVEVIDVKGQMITRKVTGISGKNSIITITLSSHTARGFFIVRVTYKMNKIVFSEKILLQ